MKIVSNLTSCIFCCLFFLHSPIFSQDGSIQDWSGEKVGVFISSRSLSYDLDFNIQVAQFLKIEEDRSNVGKMKNEFIIRLGELFSAQLQEKSNADTVYFLNADLKRGRALLEAYDTLSGNLLRPDPVLTELDHILIIDPLHIRSRIHRSVYIRSNRMITDYIPVKNTRLTVLYLNPQQPRQPQSVQVCYDEIEGPKRTTSFSFLEDKSRLGTYLSQVFSQWWLQFWLDQPGNCR